MKELSDQVSKVLYADGHSVIIGDIVETFGPLGKKEKGRVVKIFYPQKDLNSEYNWGMSGGGLLVEFDDMGLIGYGLPDEELFLVSRGVS